MKSSTKKKTTRSAKASRSTVQAKPARAAKSHGTARSHTATGAREMPSRPGAKAASLPSSRFPAKPLAKTAAKPAPRPALPAMAPKQLDLFRRLLLDRKGVLAEAYNKNKTYGRLTEDEGTQDLADKASSAYTKEFLYSLSNTDREILQKVDEALQRVDHGGFGRCLECGDEINRKRLEAVPWASHCIVCQEKVEKGLL